MVDDMDANEFQKQYAEGERNFFRVNLSRANLSRVNLSEANLDSADLTEANLSEANLSNTSLRLAKLSKADISGTNLSGANLHQADLNEALYDERTQFPNDFDLGKANLRSRSQTPIIPPDPEINAPSSESDLPTIAPATTNPETTSPDSGLINQLSKKRLTKSVINKQRIKKGFIFFVISILALVGVIVLQPLFSKLLKNNENSPLILNPRISSGDKILIEKEGEGNESFKFLKQSGVKAIAEGKYNEAIGYLERAIIESNNSPETLIYLNNAKIRKQPAKVIAVVAPIINEDRPDEALEILRGVASAQYESNQQMGTTPIKVVIANDNNKEEVAKQVASAFVQAPEILGVVGHWASQVSLAAKDIYNSGKLVAISPVSTAVELSNSSSYFFRTVPSDSVAAKKLATYMVTKLNLKRAAVFFNSQSTYSKSLKKEFTDALSQEGGEVSDTFDLYDSGFNAQDNVEKSIRRKAEVVFLAPNTKLLKEALDIAKANDNRLPLLGGDDVYGYKTLQDGGTTIEGMVVAIAWDIGDGTSTSADFRNLSIKLWGNGNVNWRTAMSYDGAKALIAAIQFQSEPTRIGVQQFLSSQDLFTIGASGKIQFQKSGDRIKPPIQLVKVVQAKVPTNGKTEYKFVPVK
jgi:branched-chain amino acid transport system substrate-binding protein